VKKFHNCITAKHASMKGGGAKWLFRAWFVHLVRFCLN
jgi:hypothetical protein